VTVLLAVGSVWAAEESENGWKVSVALGGNMAKGNSDATLTDAGVVAGYEKGANVIQLAAQGAYGEAKTEDEAGVAATAITVKKAEGSADYKRKYSEAYSYARVAALHDELAGITYRLIGGPGMGRFLVDGESVRIGMEVGVAYIAESVVETTIVDDIATQTGREEQVWAARIAQRYEHDLTETARVWQEVEYLPELGNAANFLLSAEVGIQAAINSHLGLRLAVQDKYDSTPPAGTVNNDVAVTAGLVYTL
jgi:putative salt-induced outer membrane protein YdiY